MAKDMLTVQFRLEADFETIQALRRALGDERAQRGLVSRLRETVTTSLASQTQGDFEIKVALKVSQVRQSRPGPRSPTPKVEHGLLSWYDEYEQLTNTVGAVGSADYLAWLQTEGARSFRYESDLGTFTAIKEQRGSRSVWYAHRRRGGHLNRVYLGQAENLTATKLAETARQLNAREVMSLTEP